MCLAGARQVRENTATCWGLYLVLYHTNPVYQKYQIAFLLPPHDAISLLIVIPAAGSNTSKRHARLLRRLLRRLILNSYLYRRPETITKTNQPTTNHSYSRLTGVKPRTLFKITAATMSKPVDYSKWDKIELSDDEEDVHPNIDKESWFRMKHRSRVEREDHEEKDRNRINDEVRGTASASATAQSIILLCLCSVSRLS
jgi:hypothetical protein